MSINDPMMESKHHLPECDHDPRVNAALPCICDRLRKAEQRAIAAMREPGRVRVLVEEAEQRGFHRGYRTAVDYWRTVSTRYGKRKYREGREDAARDVAAMRPRLYPDFTCINYDAAVAAARGEKP